MLFLISIWNESYLSCKDYEACTLIVDEVLTTTLYLYE